MMTMGTKKRVSEWYYLLASLTGIAEIRGLLIPHPALLCNSSCLSSPTPVVQREDSSPTQPWKGGGCGSGSPLTRAFELQARNRCLSSAYRTLLEPGSDPWRGAPDGHINGIDSPGPLPRTQT